MKYPKIEAAVRKVLRDQKEIGSTTNRAATLLTLNLLHAPDHEVMDDMKFCGIGDAEMLGHFTDLISSVVRRHLKTPVTGDEKTLVFKPGVSKQLRRELSSRTIPTWIAIEEGADAMWIPFAKARAEHFAANHAMKEKKSVQTATAAGDVQRFIDLMRTFGLKTFGEVLDDADDAEAFA